MSSCLKCIPSSLRVLILARVGLKPSHKIQNVLEKISNLEILRLEGNALGTEGTQSMSPALRFLPKLKRLNLSDNNMGSEGALALSSQLKHVPFLEHLYLYSNNLENTGVRLSLPLPLIFSQQLLFHRSKLCVPVFHT